MDVVRFGKSTLVAVALGVGLLGGAATVSAAAPATGHASMIAADATPSSMAGDCDATDEDDATEAGEATPGAGQADDEGANEDSTGANDEGANEDSDNADDEGANEDTTGANDEGANEDGDQDATDEGDDNGTPVAPGTLADGQDLLAQAGISVDEAVQAAQAEAQGDLGPVDLEDDNGNLVFKVTIGDQEVIVNAQDGTIVGTEATDTDDSDCETEGADTGAPGTLVSGQDLQSQATVTLDEAIATAQATAPGDLGTVDLEDENGTLVYKVTVGDQEVIVDATTGEVTGTEPVD